MRRALCLSFLLTFIGCSAGDVATTRVDETAGADLAIVHVNVVPMDGTEDLLGSRTILIAGDRIVAVGEDLGIPEGTTVIDGSGLFAIPGLAEMHGHIPPPTASKQEIEDTLFLYLASGITTVRGMLGAPGQLELRQQALEGGVLSPTLYLAGPSFNGQSVSSPDQARRMVRNQVREGWDLLKVHPGLTREEYDAMAQTANEMDIRFGGHVPQEVGLLQALEMSQETLDHMDGYVEALDSGAALADLVTRTLEAEAWIVPTMALWETLYGTADLTSLQSYDELRYVRPEQVEMWSEAFRSRISAPHYDAAAARKHIEQRMIALRALHQGGVPILMGTDAPQQFSVPGFSLHRELERMAQAGMTPFEIIESGTSNVGRYFSNEDTFGSIAPGHRADILLLSRNPLEHHENLSSLESLVVRGRLIPRTELDERLADIERRAAGTALR